MARRANRQQERANGPSLLQEKGLIGIVIGVGLLLMSLLLASHPWLAIGAPLLSTPGWVAIGLGMALLAADFIRKAAAAPRRTTAADTDKPDASPMPPVFHAIFDDVFGKTNPATQADAPTRRRNPARRPAQRSTVNDTGAWRAGQRTTHPTRFKQGRWSSEVLAAIEWRRFEAVCEALFAQAGFETRAQSHGADGGVDIWLHSRHAEGPVAAVQCKHWQGRQVGVKEMREFVGAMVNKVKRGTYATSSTFTTEALILAREHGIHTLDGPDLLGQIARRTPEQQASLLAVAYEGEYWRPTCASCGIKLVERKPASGGKAFWGCSNFPRCKMRMHSPAID